jgi:iron-sulfur cluster assembly protein
MGRFAILTATDAAQDRIHSILGQAGSDAQGLRLGVKNAGCAGMEYTLDVARDILPGDDLVEFASAKVYVDPKAILFLLGTEIDFEVSKLRTGFVFNNPNQVSACGCGESVELKAASEKLLAASR